MPQGGFPRRLAYYISAHGYGHGVRSCDIIRGLKRLAPETRVCIISGLPQAFFTNRLSSASISLRPGSFDLGMVQLDSIRVDVKETLKRVELLCLQRDALVRQEADYLKQNDVDLVVTDIPAIPLEAASLAGIPRIAVGNFSWDWIYSAFVEEDSRWQPVVQAFKEGYAKADLLLRLPFAGDMSAFRKAEDLPLVASAGRNRRREIASLTGSPEETKWILLSFTTLDWSEEALEAVEALDGYSFFTVLPLAWERANIHTIDREKIPFSDVVASVDAVLSKPGFGIVSECIMNGKPLIYADRSDFLEYAPLERGIRSYLRSVHIPAERLYRGDLGESLEAVAAASPPACRLAGDGGSVAASRILSFLRDD